MATPSALSRRTILNSRSVSSRFSAEVGSSMISTRNWPTTALAISTSCWSATLMLPTTRSGSAATPSSRSTPTTVRRASPQRTRPNLVGSAPRKTFSTMVSVGTTSSSCAMTEMPARRAASGLRNSTGAPLSSICPASGGSRPLSRLMIVLLPAPFSPTSAWTSPGRSSRSTPCSTSTPPNRLRMPVPRRVGAATSSSAVSAMLRDPSTPPTRLGTNELISRRVGCAGNPPRAAPSLRAVGCQRNPPYEIPSTRRASTPGPPSPAP